MLGLKSPVCMCCASFIVLERPLTIQISYTRNDRECGIKLSHSTRSMCTHHLFSHYVSIFISHTLANVHVLHSSLFLSSHDPSQTATASRAEWVALGAECRVESLAFMALIVSPVCHSIYAATREYNLCTQHSSSKAHLTENVNYGKFSFFDNRFMHRVSDYRRADDYNASYWCERVHIIKVECRMRNCNSGHLPDWLAWVLAEWLLVHPAFVSVIHTFNVSLIKFIRKSRTESACEK